MTIIWEGVGNIFDSKMQTLVNPVNTMGVMGKGLALLFKQRYPDYYRAYRRACSTGDMKHQSCFVYQHDLRTKIYSFPTKGYWGLPSKVEWIDSGLQHLAENLDTYQITSLAIPALGCGEGKLTWDIVRELLHRYCEPMPIDVEIYQPIRK